jgi:predicted metalloendopeptidase
VRAQSGLTLPDRDYYLSEGEPFTTIRNLWVPETRRTSCDLLILVE